MVPARASAASSDSANQQVVAPDPRAFGSPTLTHEDKRADREVSDKVRPTPIDSTLNKRVTLVLHAVPSAERRTMAEVARLVKDCDALNTAGPPGDWDVFVIAAGFDMIMGETFAFSLPDDWTIRGFTLNPELKGPFMVGNLRADAPRPCLLAHDCFVHPDQAAKMPKAIVHFVQETLVIGRLEVTAPSAGSLVLADHPDPDYGPPEVVSCIGAISRDVPPEARGRFDVGQGPGVRPCAAGKALSSSPKPAAAGKTVAREMESR